MPNQDPRPRLDAVDAQSDASRQQPRGCPGPGGQSRSDPAGLQRDRWNRAHDCAGPGCAHRPALLGRTGRRRRRVARRHGRTRGRHRRARTHPRVEPRLRRRAQDRHRQLERQGHRHHRRRLHLPARGTADAGREARAGRHGRRRACACHRAAWRGSGAREMATQPIRQLPGGTAHSRISTRACASCGAMPCCGISICCPTASRSRARSRWPCWPMATMSSTSRSSTPNASGGRRSGPAHFFSFMLLVVRAIVLFNPLKVFLPLGSALFLSAC